MFHSEIINNADQLNKESKNFKEIPIISNVMPRQVLDNFHQVKLEIKNLISREIYILKQEKSKSNLRPLQSKTIHSM